MYGELGGMNTSEAFFQNYTLYFFHLENITLVSASSEKAQSFNFNENVGETCADFDKTKRLEILLFLANLIYQK